MCSLAAEGGHLEVLLWARQQGFPWRDDAYDDDDECEPEHHDCCALAAAVLQWRCCSGCSNTTARGMLKPVTTPLGQGTWRSCGGRGSTAAHGMCKPVILRRFLGTWRCCSMRGRTIALGRVSRCGLTVSIKSLCLSAGLAL